MVKYVDVRNIHCLNRPLVDKFQDLNINNLNHDKEFVGLQSNKCSMASLIRLSILRIEWLKCLSVRPDAAFFSIHGLLIM